MNKAEAIAILGILAGIGLMCYGFNKLSTLLEMLK
jgi:hypothetical protein